MKKIKIISEIKLPETQEEWCSFCKEQTCPNCLFLNECLNFENAHLPDRKPEKAFNDFISAIKKRVVE